MSKLRILEPTKFEIWAERKDLTHYHLRATVNTKELETKMDVVFNTPGSKTNRKIHLIRIFNTTADWSMMSSISNLKLPYDNYHFNVYLRNMADEKSVELLVKSNQMEAVAKIGAKINGDDKKRVYSPILILKSDKDPNLMNMIPIKIEGKLIVEGERGNIEGFFLNFDKNVSNGFHTNVNSASKDSRFLCLVLWFLRQRRPRLRILTWPILPFCRP